MRIRGRARRDAPGRDAIVWIDHQQAVIVEHGADGRTRVELLDRSPTESEARFDARTVDEVLARDRLLVSGPTSVRTAFERAYVAVTHRPDRLVDVELTTSTAGTARRTG